MGIYTYNHTTTEDSLDRDIHLSLKKHPQTTHNFNEFKKPIYIKKIDDQQTVTY